MENTIVDSMSIVAFKNAMGINSLDFRQPKDPKKKDSIYAIFTFNGESTLVGTSSKGTLRADILANKVSEDRLQICEMSTGAYVLCYKGEGILYSA